MKTIKKDELFSSLSGFLKSKGVELNNGEYAARIRQGCDLLTEAVNTTQKTASRTKAQVHEALEKLRQSIHESTAPKAAAESRRAKARKTAKPRAKKPAAKRSRGK